MDPYIEADQWQEFHVQMVVEIQRHLVPKLLPKYVARVERRVYTEHSFDEVEVFQPDVEIVKATTRVRRRPQPSAIAILEPHIYAAPFPHERSEPFLKIVDRESGQLIALIEFLSPSNKTPGSDGYRAYHEKRDETLKSPTHLVEIDLLRGGTRLPTVESLHPTTDYCVFVHRAPRRFQVEVYEWPLRQPLPAVPIPLAKGDDDARLDLQKAFVSVYENAGYEAFLRYDKTLKPPLRREDAVWAKRLVAGRK
jgi:hypothetical protein